MSLPHRFGTIPVPNNYRHHHPLRSARVEPAAKSALVDCESQLVAPRS